MLAALLASQLILVLSHDAIAHGELRRLERFADQVDLVVSPGASNLLSDAAVAELRRWPALVAVELRLPLREREAAQLRKLKRLAVRLHEDNSSAADSNGIGGRRGGGPHASLRLLGPALVRVDLAPLAQKGLAQVMAEGPCPESRFFQPPEGSEALAELRVLGTGGECLPAWLASRLDLHPEGPGDPPVAPPVDPPRRP